MMIREAGFILSMDAELFILNNSGPPTTLQLGLGHHLSSHGLHTNHHHGVGDDCDRVQHISN